MNNCSIPSMHMKEKLPFVLINTLLLGGPVLKSVKKKLLQMPFLELYHVYI